MKILSDGKGKYIVDFEMLEIKVEDCIEGIPINDLFNPDKVSVVTHGNFQSVPKTEISDGTEWYMKE